MIINQLSTWISVSENKTQKSRKRISEYKQQLMNLENMKIISIIKV